MSSYLVLIALGLVVLTWFIVGSIFSPANNVAATTTTTTTTQAHRTGLDFDSEEDEGLFGKQEKSSLLNSLKQPAKSTGSLKSGLSGEPDTLPHSAPSKSPGVENIRAMPDAISSIAPRPSKSRKRESNLFGSDSEDEGDLFSSKPALSGNVTSSVSQGQGKAQLTNSSGFFSSDEDSPLFSGPSPTQGPKNSEEKNKASPSQSKESGRKVPVGGVSIFGRAIISALQKQQPSGEEPSGDDEKPPVSSSREPTPHSSKPDTHHPETSNVIKTHVNIGLFDSDDEDNLFDTLVTKSVCLSDDADKSHSNTVPSLSATNIKANEEKRIIENESPDLVGKDGMAKSTAGLFSDDEDDLFGIPTTRKNKDFSVPETQAPITDTSPAKVTAASSTTEAALKASQPPPLFLSPPDVQTPSEPINIAEPPKTNNSLFSSPSDDDDDIFSAIPRSVHRAHHTSAFVTEPPPLPPQSITTQTDSLAKGPLLPGVHDHLNNANSAESTFEGDSKEISSSDLFHSPSDEDIFSPFVPAKTSQNIPAPIVQTRKEDTEPSVEEPQLSIETVATESIKSTGHAAKDASGVNDSPDRDIFKHVPQTPGNDSKGGAVVGKDGLADAFLDSLKENKDGVIIKENNLFDSADDLFGGNEISDELNGSYKKNDSPSTLTPEIKPQTNTEPPSMAVNTASLISSEDPATLCEGTSTAESPSSSQCEPSLIGTHKPEEKVVKPPVGGVALFGGKELAAQINKRRTLLEPTEDENKKHTEKNILDVQGFLSEGGDQSKAIIFDENSDDDIFGVSVDNSEKQSTSTSLHRQSPSLFPQEAENNLLSVKQEPPKIQEKCERKPNNLDDLRAPSDTDTNQRKPKPDKCENAGTEEEENKEIKCRRKPPTGGVSMFGGGGMGGSELLAKVMQRKSMLTCESDSSEEDTPTGASKPSVPQEEKDMTVSKSMMPASLVPSYFTFPPALSESQSGGEDGSISFDDPALQSNVLQSLNKTRARGSLKRRPPSRAHRKKPASGSDPSDTPDTFPTTQTTSSTEPSNPEDQHTTASESSKIEPSQPTERLQHPPPDKDTRKVAESAESKDVEYSSAKTGSLSKSSDCVEGIREQVGGSHKKNENGTPADRKNVSEAAKSALDISKAKSGRKAKHDSLFGGSDSDDDIFGEAKQKQGARKPVAFSGATGVPKIESKNSKSHSLFEDDDDDDASIFSSRSQVNKTTAGASRNVAVTKTMGNLKQSSEPFEDPLLGYLKK